MYNTVTFGICFYMLSNIWCQGTQPLSYERNLALYGSPSHIKEYYYEYHTQEKALYYNHVLSYSPTGKVRTHSKSNRGLWDSLSPLFKQIVDPRPITITYSFTYDTLDRLVHFSKRQQQEDLQDLQQEEEWVYDAHGMLTDRSFWEVTSAGKLLKNPSQHRKVTRDGDKILNISTYNYSFDKKGLAPTDSTVYSYVGDRVDTIYYYQTNGQQGMTLKEKQYDIAFKKYAPLNVDATLFGAYTSQGTQGDRRFTTLEYDSILRPTAVLTKDARQTILNSTKWLYEPFRTTKVSNNFYALEINYDSSGYETYREEYEEGSSLYMPDEVKTRTFGKGKILHALTEVYDPVMLFYRKDTEYIYEYEQIVHTQDAKLAEATSIYPNPSKGTVHFTNFENIQELRLYTLEGRAVTTPSPKQHWSLDLPDGTYVVTIVFYDQTVKRLLLYIHS